MAEKIILTHHSQERARLRQMDEDKIKKTILDPDRVESTQTTQGQKANKFTKYFGGRKYQVVGIYKPEQKSWIVVSVWVRGENDPVSWWQQLWQDINKLCKEIWWWIFSKKSNTKK